MKNVSREQILQRLGRENPWWQAPHQVPDVYHEWHPRSYLTSFFSLVRQHDVRRAIVLMGPRRVGKTVLIHHTIMHLLEDKVPLRRSAMSLSITPCITALGLRSCCSCSQRVTMWICSNLVPMFSSMKSSTYRTGKFILSLWWIATLT